MYYKEGAGETKLSETNHDSKLKIRIKISIKLKNLNHFNTRCVKIILLSNIL